MSRIVFTAKHLGRRRWSPHQAAKTSGWLHKAISSHILRLQSVNILSIPFEMLSMLCPIENPIRAYEFINTIQACSRSDRGEPEQEHWCTKDPFRSTNANEGICPSLWQWSYVALWWKLNSVVLKASVIAHQHERSWSRVFDVPVLLLFRDDRLQLGYKYFALYPQSVSPSDLSSLQSCHSTAPLTASRPALIKLSLRYKHFTHGCRYTLLSISIPRNVV